MFWLFTVQKKDVRCEYLVNTATVYIIVYHVTMVTTFYEVCLSRYYRSVYTFHVFEVSFVYKTNVCSMFAKCKPQCLLYTS